MEAVSRNGARLPGRIDSGDGEGAFPSLDIEFDESAGSIRVYDPRLFQAGQRGFCERLLKAASRQPGVSKAQVDLASASCQIEFSPGSQSPRLMADSFIHVVQKASTGSSLIDRFCWWRRRGAWSGMTAFRLPEGVSIWETLEVEPALIRHRRPGLMGDRAHLARLADALADLEGVEACRVSPWLHRITIDVSLYGPLSDRFLDTVEQALACLNAAELLRPENRGTVPFADERLEVEVTPATGSRRLMYMAMAGGAFSMTMVGLVVPGIPTVPFLLATSYYLARSSPALNERLRHTSFFGPILQEWEQHRGLSQLSKGKLTGLTLAIVGVSIVLAPLTPVALLVIVIFSSLSIYGIARMPNLVEKAQGAPRFDGPARFALPRP
jgi:uncharacterized membrane protein YbaN (DUF454 family)